MREGLKTVLVLAVLNCAAWAADGTTAVPQESASQVLAADAITIPRLLSYQGRLTDTLGRPVPDSTYSVAFRLYAVPVGGGSFWDETQQVRVSDGLFSVLLGSVTPVGTMPDAGAVYLGMAVGGGAELTPRLRIVSAAYAYKADSAAWATAAEPVGTAGGDLAGTYPDPIVAGLQTRPVATTAPSVGQVLKWTGTRWAPGIDETGTPDNAWTRSDSVLFTVNQLGIARGGAGNVLYGSNSVRSTHVNLGVRCTTGSSGQGRPSITVSGGANNAASGSYSTVSGGVNNTASASYSAVGGGYQNTASDNSATVGGGWSNAAIGSYAVVPGGYACTTNANSGFAVGAGSRAIHSGSAAFNGQTTTAINQTRVGVLSKASGTFTIDHPLDPHGKILNHYFIEGPEMRNIYDGETVLDASGRAVVNLPDYFDALNRNPRVQLTGVGTSDVYLAEKVSGNRFVVGGKPGAEVYWQVTGERKDVSAEATRRMMPVEQPKTGDLAGTMLDDDFLSGVMDQLEREGRAQGLEFRTAAGRERYRRTQQHLREAELERGR